MTTFPYPKGAELDTLLEKRAPGLNYLWPLAVAVGLVPSRSRPSDVFDLMKSWKREASDSATIAMHELYRAATLWAWVDRVRAELDAVNVKKAVEFLGTNVDPKEYPYWDGTQHAQEQRNRAYADPGPEHDRLWREYHKIEKSAAARLEQLYRTANKNRQQTDKATKKRTTKPDRTRAFIVAEAKRLKGDRQSVGATLADMVLKLDSTTHSQPKLSRIINILGEEFRGDAAWEGRHQ